MRESRSRSVSCWVLFLAPLFLSRFWIGQSIPQNFAAFDISKDKREGSPRAIGSMIAAGEKPMAFITSDATALASGGGTALPI